ncbi:MAG: alpha/beta hydrolase [Gemmatimonadaceae bacterium]
MAPQLTRVGDLTVAVQRPATPSTKPRVLLVHGLCAGAWYWENYQTLLARHGYESHAVNLRGHHGSRPVRDIGKISLNDYVQDALEVARTLDNPIVIGHSMGGLITQKLAELGACRAAVLLAAAPPRWIPLISLLLLRKQAKHLPDILRFKPIRPDRSDADVLMFNRTPVADRDAQFARLVADSGRVGFEISFGLLSVHENRVTAPVLAVTGLDDQFVPSRVVRALARKYRAPLRQYPSFAHHILTEPGWEKPCGDVIQWMDQVARA